MDDLLRAFDARTFREQGHRVVDLLADYLGAATARADMPVLPWVPPNEAGAAWPCDFSRAHAGGTLALLERVVHPSNHLHHPRDVGHQVTSARPLTALCWL